MPRGQSNTTIFVSDGQRRWVVRVDGFDPVKLGLSRSVEWRVLYKAAAAGLAPQPVYANPDIGVLICEYLKPDEDAEESLEATAKLLRDIHCLPPVRFQLDPLQRARRYLHMSGQSDLPASLLETCDALDRMEREQRLCHNDLLRANRLQHQGKVYALDWEYAAMGDPLFDLAAIVEGDALSEDGAAALHSAWLGHKPDENEQRHLALQRSVYRELEALWSAATKADTGAQPDLR